MKKLAGLAVSIFCIASFNNADCKNTEIEAIECEISGSIDFEKKKIWFHSTSESTLLISLTGSTLHLDKMLDINGDDSCIRTYSTQCLAFLQKGKPNKHNFVEIDDFEKAKSIFHTQGYIEFSCPVFRLSKDKILSGPYVLKNRIRLSKAKPGDLDESEMLFFRVE